ncbi:hypothetical protein [Dactylosporangium vinaceum]|uniref:Uncharacterized protein n=1 Tax=Dactylosporangium vinaceum TaxID=53362 RepID=A0ABV5MAC3_9ACTN|nr:hypothetical protein [Dactylosporangium vinaceum]
MAIPGRGVADDGFRGSATRAGGEGGETSSAAGYGDTTLPAWLPLVSDGRTATGGELLRTVPIDEARYADRAASGGRCPALLARRCTGGAVMGLSSYRCESCERRVKEPLQKSILGRSVCAGCVRATLLGAGVTVISGDPGAGAGVWSMLMRKLRRGERA